MSSTSSSSITPSSTICYPCTEPGSTNSGPGFVQNPFSSFPTYHTPVVDPSSICDDEIVKLITSKASTSSNSFQCSSLRVKEALYPFVDNQLLFFSAFENVDKENSSSNNGSSLLSTFLSHFPLKPSIIIPTKEKDFKTNQSKINKLTKVDATRKVISIYNIVKQAESSKYFRQAKKHTLLITKLVDEATKTLTDEQAKLLDSKILQGLNRTQQQIERKYLQKGGFVPSDPNYRYCVFCKHEFIDEPPENKSVETENKRLEEEHRKLKQAVEDYKNKKTKDPPVSSTGRPITDRVPSLKLGSLILQCHCHQMRCVREGSLQGSTCNRMCRKPGTNKRCEWREDDDGIKKCTCEVCICPCKKAYKIGDIPQIMAVMALE